MPVPTAPPASTAASPARPEVAAGRRPSSAAISSVTTSASDVAPPVCPLGKARPSPRPIVRSTTGLPKVVSSPVSPGPPSASAAIRNRRRTRQSSASATAAVATNAGFPNTTTSDASRCPGSASTARSRCPSTRPGASSPAYRTPRTPGTPGRVPATGDREGPGGEPGDHGRGSAQLGGKQGRTAARHRTDGTNARVLPDPDDSHPRKWGETTLGDPPLDPAITHVNDGDRFRNDIGGSID